MPNQYQQQIDNVLQRELSRAEFLKVSGIAILGIIGITGFLKNLHQSVPDRPAHKRTSNGYGGSAYGR